MTVRAKNPHQTLYIRTQSDLPMMDLRAVCAPQDRETAVLPGVHLDVG